MGSKLRQAVQHCAQLVRRHDYEHYLAALYLPRQHQPAQFVLRAFNVETSLAADKTKDTTVALMRLTWWRDRLEALQKGGAVADQPVLQGLAGLREHCRLSPHWFARILEARMEDVVAESPPKTLKDLESYAESTSSAMLYLGLESAGIRNVNADHAASHVGKAEGLALLLRAASWHSARRRSHIPLDVASKHGMVHEDVYRGRASPPFKDACLQVAQVAMHHLEHARALSQSVPPEAKPFLLPAVGVGLFLKELQRRDFNALDASFLNGIWGVAPLWFHTKVLMASWQNRY